MISKPCLGRSHVPLNPGEVMSCNESPALSGAILPTFLYYAGASLVGLIAITTNSLVDGIFVGNYVGGQALAAITLLIPCFTVLFAIALMFAIGGSVSAGKHMGADDSRSASDVFSQTILATVAVSSLFALASYGFEAQLFGLLNVPNELVPLVAEYFGVIRWVLVVQLSTMVLYYFVRADGHPLLATTALVVGALCNVGLDALFVMGCELGLRGAAYALAISQVIQCGVLSLYFISPERSLSFVPRQTSWKRLLHVSYNGASEFINEISAGLIFLLLNHLLVEKTGVQGLAAFSVVNYFIFLSLMLSYGIADALHLLASQNYGAQNQDRIQSFLLTALLSSLSLGVLLALLLVGFRNILTGWFLGGDDIQIAEEAVELIWVVWPLFLVNEANIIFSCYLTAVHRPKPSALIAMMRGLVLPATFLTVFYVLFEQERFRGGFSQWSFLAALPLAEWVTFILAFALCYRYRPAVLRF